MLQFPVQLPDNARGKAAVEHPRAWAPGTPGGDQDGAPDSWPQPGPDLATAPIWGVNQQIEALCFSSFYQRKDGRKEGDGRKKMSEILSVAEKLRGKKMESNGGRKDEHAFSRVVAREGLLLSPGDGSHCQLLMEEPCGFALTYVLAEWIIPRAER